MWVKMPYASTERGSIIAVRKLQHKGRIQVPKEVQMSLKISEGDSIFWVKTTDGKWVVERA